jgi:hypothetical protein
VVNTTLNVAMERNGCFEKKGKLRVLFSLINRLKLKCAGNGKVKNVHNILYIDCVNNDSNSIIIGSTMCLCITSFAVFVGDRSLCVLR